MEQNRNMNSAPKTDRKRLEIPEDISFSMLPRVSQARLRGLSKDHAEIVGCHIVAAQQLISTEPEVAYLHAQAAVKMASRIEFTREVLGIVAYQLGKYEVALRELRTARRINGHNDYLPMMADAERGLGHPEKALALAASPEAKSLEEAERIEMAIVAAGARADIGEKEAGLALLNRELRARGLSTPCRLRLMEAKASFLEELGRIQEAEQLYAKVESINEKYEDPRDEEIIVFDLEDDDEQTEPDTSRNADKEEHQQNIDSTPYVESSVIVDDSLSIVTPAE